MLNVTRRLFVFSCINIFTYGVHAAPPHSKVILFVWDGLRPDSITKENTPTLYELRQKGVNFQNNHSTFPTFTMMNAQSFATGNYAYKTGYYGNYVYEPYAIGNDTINSKKDKVDFKQIVFTEDYKILEDLNRKDKEEPLFFVDSLISQADKANLITVVVGKSGPAFLQDYESDGLILDEAHVYPLSFAKELQAHNYSLPKSSVNDFKELKLSEKNGDPSAPSLKTALLKDSQQSDPTDHQGSRYNRQNEYLADIFIHYIIPEKKPDLSIFWLRNPDSTEHDYGPGSFNHLSALKDNDKILKELIRELHVLGEDKNTNIIIVSDHGHSNVSGDTRLFPLRKIENGKVTEIDNVNGFSVSGNIRTVELIASDSILKSMKVRAFDSGSTEYMIPEVLESKDVIIAPNGGSEYVYVPSRNKDVVKALVKFYQTHHQYDSVFVSDAFGKVPGTLPLSLVKLEKLEICPNSSRDAEESDSSRGADINSLCPKHRNPDIVVGMTYDENQKINGLPGTLYSSNSNYFMRGSHGSFSPVDIHNTLVAYGPSFKKSHKDLFPTGNVDVAPTIAHILNIPLANTDGRILAEALNGSVFKPQDYKITSYNIKPSEVVSGLEIFDADQSVTNNKNYSFELNVTKVTYNGRSYEYFDKSKAQRW